MNHSFTTLANLFLVSGSFATASCLICKYKVDCEAIREDIFNQVFAFYYN